MRTSRAVAVVLTALLMTLAMSPAVAAQSEEPGLDDDSPQVVLDWNGNTLAATGIAGIAPAVTNLYLAMVHGAMHDVVHAITGRYQPYLAGLEADPSMS